MDVVPDFIHAATTTVMNVIVLFSMVRPRQGMRSVCNVTLLMLGVDCACAAWIYLQHDTVGLTQFSVLRFMLIGVLAKSMSDDSLTEWFFGFIAAWDVYAIIAVSSRFLYVLLPMDKDYAVALIRLIMFAVFIVVFNYFLYGGYRKLCEKWNGSLPVQMFLCANCAFFITVRDHARYYIGGRLTPIFLSVVLICAAYFWVMRRSAESAGERLRRELEIKEEGARALLNSELDYYKELEEVSRKMRHDIRHNNSLLLEYLDSGDTEGAKEYLKRYDDGLSKTKTVEYCKNSVANAVFRMYARRAGAIGAAFEVKADIPAKTDIPVSEFGVLLSNLLENGCEACACCPEAGRFIKISASRDGGRLLINIHNSVSGAVQFDGQGLPVSTKENGGTGTKSVEKTVLAHGGMARFRQIGDEFIAQVILPFADGDEREKNAEHSDM